MHSKPTSPFNTKTLFLLISLIIATLDGTLVTINYFLSKSALKKDFSTESAALHSAFQVSKTDTQRSLMLIATIFAEDAQVQQLFLQGKQAVEKEGGGPGKELAAKYRKQLYELIAPRWNKAMKTQGARQLHFHLGPGSLSFLRVHRPEKYGDRMDNVRFTIVDTNAEQSPRSGFETGRVYSGIRGMVPVYAKDNNGHNIHVGTLESGTSFEKLVSSFKHASGSDITVFLRKDHVDKNMWPDFVKKRFKPLSPCGCVIEASSIPIQLELLEQAEHGSDKRIIRNGKAQVFKVNQNYYSASFFPLRDYLGEKTPEREDVGSIMIWKNISERIALFHQDQLVILIWGILSFLFIEVLLYWGFRRGTLQLRSQIKQKTFEQQENHRRIQTLMTNIPGMVYRRFNDQNWTMEFVSDGCMDLTGYAASDLINSHIISYAQLIHSDDQQHVWDTVQAGLKSKSSFELLYRLITSSEIEKWVLERGTGIFNSAGELLAIEGLIFDITERIKAEEKLKLGASVFTNAWEGILITDADSNIIDINDAFIQITGYSRDEVLGKKPNILHSGHHSAEFYQTMWQELKEKSHWSSEIWNKRKSGEIYAELLTISVIRDENNKITNYVGLFSDITKQKNQQQQLEDIAHFDALTHLPNRLLLADRLRQAINHSDRIKQGLAVVFLDLDGFKEINDNYGHDIGDQLLITVSMRMKNVLRDEDTIARIGGDEFVAVLLDLQNIQDCLPMLDRLLKAASKTVEAGNKFLRVSASLGVTFYPQQIAVDADQLIRQADQAMYNAKQAGKNCYQVFDAEQDSNIRGLHKNLQRLKLALERNEFVLYYQPKVNMSSGEILGVEALIRWLHPEKGLLLPAEFLPLIDAHPLGIKLGEWVIETALSQRNSWLDNGMNIAISINISGYQLQQDNFTERLEKLLSAHTHPLSNYLELEVLESSAIKDLTKVSRVIKSCKKLGVHFSLDDFGTGYSSLTYLKKLPVSWMKIDRSFVRDMLNDPDDLAILEGVIGMATAFRHHLIAEGVESIEHGELLLQLGCKFAQGFGIAHPMPADNLPVWISNWKPDPLWTAQQTVSRDDLALLLASIEHRAWVRGINNYIMNKQESLPPVDHTKCRFGHWLVTEGKDRYRSQAVFASVEKLHRQVHSIAQDLLLLQSQGNNPQAMLKIKELYNLRDLLLDKLRLLVNIVSKK